MRLDNQVVDILKMPRPELSELIGAVRERRKQKGKGQAKTFKAELENLGALNDNRLTKEHGRKSSGTKKKKA